MCYVLGAECMDLFLGSKDVIDTQQKIERNFLNGSSACSNYVKPKYNIVITSMYISSKQMPLR